MQGKRIFKKNVMLEYDCQLLFSEDMQDGLKIGSLTIRNIFAD